MRTVYLTKLHQLELRETSQPRIQRDTDVLLRITTVGVCGSDVHYFHTGRIGALVVKFPAVLGHECCGRVEAVGKGVKALQPGDRVAIDPLIWCGQCDQCRKGRIHTCRQQAFLGCPGQAEGSMSDYVVMPEASLLKVPAGMTDDQAVMAEPLSIGLWTVKQALAIRGSLDGAKILIQGAGPIGLCTLLALKTLCHPKQVLVTDPIEERLAIACKCGADWTGSPKRGSAKEIAARVPEGVDCVFECAGKQETIDEASELLTPGGVLTVVGIAEGNSIALNMNNFRRKELVLQNVRRQNECMGQALELVASGRLNVDPLVTHHLPLEESQAAFDLVAGYRDGVVKAMVTLE